MSWFPSIKTSGSTIGTIFASWTKAAYLAKAWALEWIDNLLGKFSEIEKTFKEIKSDGTPVSNGDLEVNRIITKKYNPKNKNFFIVYSDINWNWKFQEIDKYIKNKKVVIFTHKGFQPDLETNNKSDFCSVNKKNYINRVSEKKLIFKSFFY